MRLANTITASPISRFANLAGSLGEAARAVEALFLKARSRARTQKLAESDQHALHALAWFATYAELLTELGRLCQPARKRKAGLARSSNCWSQIAAGEYLHHIIGGMPMNQAEYARLGELGLTPRRDCQA